jgi:hypothetical protein
MIKDRLVKLEELQAAYRTAQQECKSLEEKLIAIKEEIDNLEDPKSNYEWILNKWYDRSSEAFHPQSIKEVHMYMKPTEIITIDEMFVHVRVIYVRINLMHNGEYSFKIETDEEFQISKDKFKETFQKGEIDNASEEIEKLFNIIMDKKIK